MHTENYGWGMGFGWSFMVLFWLLVIIGIVYIATLLVGRTNKPHIETALDILKKRYAKGEISREEFREMADELAKTGDIQDKEKSKL